MTSSCLRYDYADNLARARQQERGYSRYWPSASSYTVFFLELGQYAKHLPDGFLRGLDILAGLIDREWHASKHQESSLAFVDGTAIAQCLRDLSRFLDADDAAALLARADYVEFGAHDGVVDRLLRADQQVVVFAGCLSTWVGKDVRGRPSAFAFQRSAPLSAALEPLLQDHDSISRYLDGMHKRLFFTDPPEFMAGELLFMAGEANLHPKHIAYFLPEDEGIKRSVCKRTFYLSNAHLAKLDHIAWPLCEEFIPDAVPVNRHDSLRVLLPAAGVLAHELGHFVRRDTTAYAELNKQDRWISIVLQEVCADVFGTLFLSELWAPRMGASAEQAISYYLADSLSYINRGLGYFPDSDGMLLQLNYLAEFGAIRVEEGVRPTIHFSAQAVIAGLRSLARVLADTLLDNRADRACSLHRHYGPQNTHYLQPVLAVLAQRAPQTIEYVQDYATCN